MGFYPQSDSHPSMESLILNALWLSPLFAAGIALILPRLFLSFFTGVHGAAQVLAWLYLYQKALFPALSYEMPWFSLGEKQFFYAIGFHSANAALILLTILIGHIALLYGLGYVGRPDSFAALSFLVMAFSQGVFLAKDIFLFFIFYEGALIPAFLLIYGWGGVNRREAAVKFALFTLGGSVFLLVGLLMGIGAISSGRHEVWAGGTLSWVVWLFMTIGLAVKLPLVPLHSWLGDAHVEADSAISMVLAGILLKLGGYALLYWVWIGLSPEEVLFLRIWGGLSMVYAAAVATGQTDVKRLIAFTSIGHMALVPMGAAAHASEGLSGAYHQLFTHGIVSAGLFAWVGMIEKRFGTRILSKLHGVLFREGRVQFLTVLLFFGAIGVPGMALFISEMLIVWGMAKGAGWTWALIPASGILLTAIYFLRAYRELIAPGNHSLSTAPFGLYEGIVWLLLLVSLGVGLYPKVWLDLLSHVGR